MKSEALRVIKTMHQINTGLDMVKNRKIRSTNSLSRSREELEHVELLTDRRLGQVLVKERARFATFDASVNKSRQRLIKSRERLAATINRNRALIQLRHELQRARWEGNDPAPLRTEQSYSQQKLHQMELRY